MPFNYLSSSISNNDNNGSIFNSNRSIISSSTLNDNNDRNRTEGHEFTHDMCRICSCCGTCTSFGSRCCRCISQDRLTDRGQICGCGKGDGGCKRCRMCRTCTEAIDIDICPGLDHLYRLSKSDGDKSNEEDSILEIGTRVISQWQRQGGTLYPGKIIAANNDGTYDIQYDDGDHDERVPTNRISLIRKIKNEPRARRIEDRGPFRRQQINLSSPRNEMRRFGAQSNNATGNDPANKELRSIERHLFQLARSLTGGLDLEWEQDSDHPLEKLRNLGRNGRPTSSNNSTSNHHTGLMQCKCNHAMGRLSYPLDSDMLHLAGRCKWLCCGADWNDPSPCPSSGTSEFTTKPSKDSSSSLNYKVLSYPELFNEFIDIPMTTGNSYEGNYNFITNLPSGFIAMPL